MPRLTGRSRRTVPRLLKDIRLARARGYAVDDEESADSVVGLAVVVPTRGVRAPILAISVTKHKSDWNDEVRDRFVAELDRVARLLGNPMATG